MIPNGNIYNYIIIELFLIVAIGMIIGYCRDAPCCRDELSGYILFALSLIFCGLIAHIFIFLLMI